MTDYLCHRLDAGVMYAQNCARNGPVTDIFKNTFLRWKWGHLNRPVLNDAGVQVDTSATFEQALMSDELLSSVSPCNETFHLSKAQDDFNPAAFDKWSKALSEGGAAMTLGCTARHQVQEYRRQHPTAPHRLWYQQSMVTWFAASLRTDNCPQPKEARPLSHALTSD